MIVVDITTSHREQGRLPHGIRRVERCIVAALVAMNRADVAFCRYDRRRHALVTVPAAAPLRLGRGLETWLRLNLRDRLWRPLVAALRPGHAGLAPGSTLVLLSGIGT